MKNIKKLLGESSQWNVLSLEQVKTIKAGDGDGSTGNDGNSGGGTTPPPPSS